MDVSTNDGVFVVGTTTGALPGETNAGGIDGWIRQYDRYGNVIWSDQFGTSGDDIVYGIGGNSVVGLFIGGSTTGAFPDQTNAGGADMFVRKYYVDGSYAWTSQEGTAANDEILDVDSYGTLGNFFVGRTDGDMIGTNAGGYDAIFGTIGNDGDIGPSYQWGTSGDDAATGISVYSQGTTFVSGYTDGTLPDQTSAGGRDAFIIKFGTSLTPAWTHQIGSSLDDEASGVGLNDASVVVGGFASGTLPDQTSAGGVDAFAAAYNDAGDPLWLTQFGTSGDDRIVDVGGTANFVTSSVIGETTGAFPNATNAGGTDIFAGRFDPNGNLDWAGQYGTSGNDHPLSGELDFSAQHVYAVGRTSGTFAGETSAGGTDAFLMKIIQDNDSDGIFNEVDVLPYDFTSQFLDEETQTDTSGEILDRGGSIVHVYDVQDPAIGVRVHVDAGASADPADVAFCSGIANSELDPGDALVVTCGSATIGVEEGVVDTTFLSPEGLITTTAYDAGNELRYDPASATFEADEENVDDIVVSIGATEQIIGPGATIKMVPLAADSFLREGHANQNEGMNPMLVLRKQGSTRPVVKFDLSGISLTGLAKATLVLSIGSSPPAQWGGNGRAIEVRRITQTWAEGNGKDIDVPEAEATRGTGNGVTWNCGTDTDIADHQIDCSGTWNGGSFAARTAPTVTILNNMTGEISFDVTQDVLNGGGNGWLIKKVDENQNGNVKFYSKEGASGDPSLAPKLILEY